MKGKSQTRISVPTTTTSEYKLVVSPMAQVLDDDKMNEREFLSAKNPPPLLHLSHYISSPQSKVRIPSRTICFKLISQSCSESSWKPCSKAGKSLAPRMALWFLGITIIYWIHLSWSPIRGFQGVSAKNSEAIRI